MTHFYKDKQQIINWLDKYGVKKYGFVVDVNNDVDLNSKFNLTNK